MSGLGPRGTGSILLTVVALLCGLAATAGAAAKRPDLVVPRVVGVAPTMAPGDAFQVGVEVANRGARKARRTRLVLLLSTDGRRSADDTVLVAGKRVRSLAPRRRQLMAVALELPRRTGRFQVIACVRKVKGERGPSARNNCRASAPTQVEPREE